VALTVGNLCFGLPGIELTGNTETSITKITADSRLAGPDVLFVAVPGTGRDGHAFVDDVLDTGCMALVLQKDRVEQGPLFPDDFSGTVVLADRTRPLPALLGRRLNGDPDRNLWTAGVTGTNGKTTVSFLIREMLNRLHGPCGLLGTIIYEDGKTRETAPLTTPPGDVFYGWLGRMVTNRCQSVAMELSSHGLDQERTAGLGLDVAVMTNIGRDHLDYHSDAADYLAAKAKIMELLRTGTDGAGRGRPGVLVLNQDDPNLACLDTAGHETVRFSTNTATDSTYADLMVRSAVLAFDGTRLVLYSDRLGDKDHSHADRNCGAVPGREVSA